MQSGFSGAILISVLDMDRQWDTVWYHKAKMPRDRHSGGVNILFIDGHVDYYKFEAVPIVYNPVDLSTADRVKYWGPRDRF